MKSLARVASLCILVATVALIASPADAAQARRIWRASIGGGSVSGSATLLAYTTGTGTMTITAHGLKPSTTYQVMVYRGTCARPISVVKLPGIRADATGLAKGSLALNAGQQATVWRASGVGAIAARIATGSDAHCGVLKYAVATRVAMPALPVGVAAGRRFAMYRASLPLAGLRAYFWGGKAGDALGRWHQVVGLEGAFRTDGIWPIRVPGVQILGGVGYSLSEPVRHDTQLYLTIDFRP